VSQKKRHPFIFVISLPDVRFCQFLAEAYPQGIGNKHIYAVFHISVLFARIVPCKIRATILIAYRPTIQHHCDTALHCPMPVATE